MTDEGRSQVEGWMKKAQDALKKASDAATEAWKSTEGVRSQAWETAKRAAVEATEAIDQGLEVARSSWQEATESEEAQAPTEAADASGDDDDPGETKADDTQ